MMERQQAESNLACRYLELEASGASHVKTTLVRQGARSHYVLTEAALGAELSRHDLGIEQVTLSASPASAENWLHCRGLRGSPSCGGLANALMPCFPLAAYLLMQRGHSDMCKARALSWQTSLFAVWRSQCSAYCVLTSPRMCAGGSGDGDGDAALHAGGEWAAA